MKLEEFRQYKNILESDVEMLSIYPEAERVYRWMEKTGRIDESFWGAIWSWLKRNFSPTARKLHSLAEDYEKELTSEIEAEYGRLKNSKDLESQFRRSFAGRVADDIEDKMLLVAGDDDDYRELARVLVNKKKLRVKKKMLVQFSGRMDPEDVKGLEDEIKRDMDKAESDYERVVMKISRDKREQFKEISQDLHNRIIGTKRKFEELGYTSNEKIERLVRMVIYYQNALEVQQNGSFTVKASRKTLDDYLTFVLDIAKKLERGKVSKDEAILATVKAAEYYMKSEKPQTFDKMSAAVFKRAEDKLKAESESNSSTDSEEDEARERVTTSHTEDIMSRSDVEAAVDDAAEDTGKKTPSADEIVQEIKASVRDYFSQRATSFREEIALKVQHFNGLSTEERKKSVSKLDYELDANNKLSRPTVEDMEVLFKNLVQIAGAIVPYFNIDNGKRSKSFLLALDYMFEIYAVKKDPTGKLLQADIDTILDNMKEKYK